MHTTTMVATNEAPVIVPGAGPFAGWRKANQLPPTMGEYVRAIDFEASVRGLRVRKLSGWAVRRAFCSGLARSLKRAGLPETTKLPWNIHNLAWEGTVVTEESYAEARRFAGWIAWGLRLGTIYFEGRRGINSPHHEGALSLRAMRRWASPHKLARRARVARSVAWEFTHVRRVPLPSLAVVAETCRPYRSHGRNGRKAAAVAIAEAFALPLGAKPWRVLFLTQGMTAKDWNSMPAVVRAMAWEMTERDPSLRLRTAAASLLPRVVVEEGVAAIPTGAVHRYTDGVTVQAARWAFATGRIYRTSDGIVYHAQTQPGADVLREIEQVRQNRTRRLHCGISLPQDRSILVWRSTSLRAGNCESGTDAFVRENGWAQRQFVPAEWLVGKGMRAENAIAQALRDDRGKD